MEKYICKVFEKIWRKRIKKALECKEIKERTVFCGELNLSNNGCRRKNKSQKKVRKVRIN